MATVLSVHWDYLLFLGGMVYVYLAFTLLSLRTRDRLDLPWGALASFGILMAVQAWLEMASPTLDLGAWGQGARLTLLGAALLGLGCFAERGWVSLGGPGAPWAPPLALALAGLGAWSIPGSFEALARGGLGVLGGLGAGAVILQAVRRSGRSRRAFTVAAVALGLSVLPAALAAALQRLHPEAAGAPTLLRALSAILVFTAALALWTQGQALRRRHPLEFALLGLVLLLQAGGFVVAESTGRRVSERIHSQLLDLAKTTAASIRPSQLALLEGSPRDLSHPAYLELRDQLGQIHRSLPRIRFVYLMTLREGQVVFLADSEPPGSKDFSPPGKVYADASPELRRALGTSTAFTEGPLRDEYGTWVSALAPVPSLGDGPVVLLGLDLDARDLAFSLARARLTPILGLVLLCLLLLAVELGQRREREAREILARAAEDRAVLLDAVDIQVWFLTDPETYGAVNKAFAAYNGWFQEDISHKPLGQVLQGKVLEEALAINRQVFQDRAPLRYECWAPDALGRAHYLAIALMPRLDEAERVEFVVGSAVDLTERQQAEQARLALERRLEQVRRAESLGRMAGAVAHQFNNLLGATLGSLELALHQLPSDHPAAARIERAHQAAERASEISLQMLTYLGRDAEVERERLDLSQACRALTAELGPRLPGAPQVDLDLAEGLPAVELDPDHLQALLLHLLTNAAEAAADRPEPLRVRTWALPEGVAVAGRLYPVDWARPAGPLVVLEVADPGPGLGPEAQEHLFEPFFSTKFTGRGLGLATALGIARTYGGSIAVESVAGRGCVFRVLLPAVR